MAIYTGVADANGDFNIPFSENYTGGQKVTVTAEKDSAEKTIEIYAPSAVQQMSGISFSGSLDNFPDNIGVVTLTGFTGSIGNYAFQSPTVAANSHFFNKATGLVIGSGVTVIGVSSFQNWLSALSLILPDSLVTVQGSAFLNWKSALSLTFGSNIQTVVASGFAGWGSMLSLTIPDTITTIGNYAFSQWKSATSLQIGSGLTVISPYAFYDWSALPEIMIPNNITTISNNAFMSCTACKEVTIGTGVTSIGQQAFRNLTSCDEIICLATTPPTISNATFDSLKAGCIFKVPSASLTAYQTAANWSSFASQMVGV